MSNLGIILSDKLILQNLSIAATLKISDSPIRVSKNGITLTIKYIINSGCPAEHPVDIGKLADDKVFADNSKPYEICIGTTFELTLDDDKEADIYDELKELLIIGLQRYVKMFGSSVNVAKLNEKNIYVVLYYANPTGVPLKSNEIFKIVELSDGLFGKEDDNCLILPLSDFNNEFGVICETGNTSSGKNLLKKTKPWCVAFKVAYTIGKTVGS